VKRLEPPLEAALTFGYYQVPTPTDPKGYYKFNGSDLQNRSLLGAGSLIAHELMPGFPDLRWLIIGPSDHGKSDALTHEIAREFGIAQACIFTGVRQDMPDLYALMAVFVLPSHREGFPRAPMEASAMGVPCVVTDIRGCRQVVEPGRNGLRVPVNDVPALACAVAMLLKDRARAQQMGQEGRRIALERFDEQLVFERVRAEYARLLHANGLPIPDLALTAPAF